AGRRRRGAARQPRRVGLAGLGAALARGRRELAAAPGIKRRAVRVARPTAEPLALSDQGGDLTAGLEARIEQAQRIELVQRRLVVGEMLALPPHRLLPGDSKPGQVFVDRRLAFRPRA